MGITSIYMNLMTNKHLFDEKCVEKLVLFHVFSYCFSVQSLLSLDYDLKKNCCVIFIDFFSC